MTPPALPVEQTTPRVAVVILNWNQPQLTLDCLASLQAMDYPNYSALVVDNGSADDSVARISATYPGVEVLALDENLGYAEGNNRGMAHALAHGADYVLILNNDTLVAPDMLSRLVAFAASRPCLGIAGPTMFCAEPADTLFAAGSGIDWQRGVTENRGMFRAAAAYPLPAAPEMVDFIAGCAVLATRRLIDSVGGLDSGYYLNYEDVEWCVRARRQGFEVWHVPQAVMWHRVSATFGLGSPANTYYMTRNALRFFWTNAPPASRPLAVASILARTLRTVGAWTIKPRYHSEVYRRRRDANILAVRDFLRRHDGKMGQDVAAICYPATQA